MSLKLCSNCVFFDQMIAVVNVIHDSFEVEHTLECAKLFFTKTKRDTSAAMMVIKLAEVCPPTMSRSKTCRDCSQLDEYNGTFYCEAGMFTMYVEAVLDLAENCPEYKPLLTWVVCWTGGRESLLRTQSEAREVAESRQKQDRRDTKYWIEEVY